MKERAEAEDTNFVGNVVTFVGKSGDALLSNYLLTHITMLVADSVHSLEQKCAKCKIK